MALNRDHIQSTTKQLFNDSSADNIFRGRPLTEHLLRVGKVVRDGGREIVLPVIKAKTSAAGSFSKYDNLSTAPNEQITSAKYDYKREFAHMIISEHEILLNSGASQVVNLVRTYVDNAMRTLKDNIATGVYSANADADKGITGLRTIVKATGTVGDIDQADFSGWASQIDSSTTALTLAKMEELYLLAKVGTDMPDLIVTTRGVFAKYWGLLQAEQKFGPGNAGRGGFQFLLFNEVPVIDDPACPGSGSGSADNHMFMVNSNWLYLFVHRNDNMRVKDIGDVPDQDVIMQRVTWTGNLCTDNRRMLAAFTTLQH